MCFRVTHVDHHQRRRQLLLECAARADAEDLALALFGDATYLSTVRLRNHAGAQD